jgi:hypothetical protein
VRTRTLNGTLRDIISTLVASDGTPGNSRSDALIAELAFEPCVPRRDLADRLITVVGGRVDLDQIAPSILRELS